MTRSRLALGLMSGTSADGVSLALVRLSGRRLSVESHDTCAYGPALRGRILAAGSARAPDLARLHFDLGRAFAAAASRFLRRRRVPPRRLACVGSHGQTVVHLPDGPRPATLQIGEPSFLAEALGAPVVSDFRPRDMAAGGQGAPLAPFLDEFLFGDGPPRALQNIGGIANVALVGKGVEAFGFDTGPGNCLIDIAARRATRGRLDFDRDGRLALRGTPDTAAADSALKHPFFARRPPKSLDRAQFAEAFFERLLGRLARRRPVDAVATATYLTALTIADQYRRFVLPRARVREAVVSGGGALNPELMRLLKALLPVPVVSIAERGLPPLAKEPALMALMALKAVCGDANGCPRATGASKLLILGKISPARPR